MKLVAIKPGKSNDQVTGGIPVSSADFDETSRFITALASKTKWSATIVDANNIIDDEKNIFLIFDDSFAAEHADKLHRSVLCNVDRSVLVQKVAKLCRWLR
jgi:hypothetical protein